MAPRVKPTGSYFYVYEHWRPDTGVCFYVGKGQRHRAWYLKGRNGRHRAIVSKLISLGLTVDVRVIASELSESEALKIEIARIALYPKDQLTNQTMGGEGVSGLVMPLKARRKMALAKLGKKRGPYTAEHRLAIGIGQKGKKLSEEHRYKLKLARRNRITKPETIAKRAENFKNWSREKYEAWRANLSKAHLGHSLSAETKAKIAESNRLAWCLHRRTAI